MEDSPSSKGFELFQYEEESGIEATCDNESLEISRTNIQTL